MSSNEGTISSITDLPLDILVLVFPYLDAKSFLAFCSTCKAFQQNSIRLDPAYWSHATRSTFRVPNQPIVQHDGVRWQKLFRRLLTQTRVYTWGSNGQYRLGHSYPDPEAATMGPYRGRRRIPDHLQCSWPKEMERTRELGIIADMQCGGWSTTILTSKGLLYTAGVLDGQRLAFGSNGQRGPSSLRFPVGFPYSTSLAQYEEPTIAIRQFSAGRSHILGLSDSGRIWSWYGTNKPALHVKLFNVDITEASSGQTSTASTPLSGRVKRVLAGWSRSSAYIYGYGIVVWDPVERARNEQDETDTMLVMENAEVPRTGYQRPTGAYRETDEEKALGEEVGTVLNYIILEHYVVFVTDIGKVFCGRFGEKHEVEDIVELRALRNENDTPIDVQGTFRRFAVFKNGEVITADQDYLEACWNAHHSRHGHDDEDEVNIPGLHKIPALQQNDVISVAFGDYHFLALHSNGRITSYGTENQACGALGLGGGEAMEREIRGIVCPQGRSNGKLLPHAYAHGRQVFFEQEKKEWISFMAAGGKDPKEAKERIELFLRDRNVQGETSEWFEQEGRDWEKRVEVREDDDGLPSHFALSVSAAGWHSGAVVLVNQELADRVRESCIIRDPESETAKSKAGEASASAPQKEQDGREGSWGLASLLTWLWEMGRVFLGLRSTDEQNVQASTSDIVREVQAGMKGATLEDGERYRWSEDSFPRLKLSNGEEMPGTVEFNEWRFGRPEWNIDASVPFDANATIHGL